MSGAVPLVALADRFPTALDCVRVCVHENGLYLKTIAAGMALSPSDLSRKLANNPVDPRRFTLSDLEAYVTFTGDTTPILYLVQKFIPDFQGDQNEVLNRLVVLLPELQSLLRKAGVA